MADPFLGRRRVLLKDRQGTAYSEDRSSLGKNAPIKGNHEIRPQVITRRVASVSSSTDTDRPRLELARARASARRLGERLRQAAARIRIEIGGESDDQHVSYDEEEDSLLTVLVRRATTAAKELEISADRALEKTRQARQVVEEQSDEIKRLEERIRHLEADLTTKTAPPISKETVSVHYDKDKPFSAWQEKERKATIDFVCDMITALRTANFDRGLWRLAASLRRHHLIILRSTFSTLRRFYRRPSSYSSLPLASNLSSSPTLQHHSPLRKRPTTTPFFSAPSYYYTTPCPYSDTSTGQALLKSPPSKRRVPSSPTRKSPNASSFVVPPGLYYHTSSSPPPASFSYENVAAREALRMRAYYSR